MQILDVNLQNANRQKWWRHQISETLIDQPAIPGTLNNHVLMDGNGETTIFYVMIWNHPVETVIRNCLFGVPGWSVAFITNLKRNAPSNRHVTNKISFDPSLPKCQKKKHPWMFKQPKSATEVQKETSFSGRPLRRKSCMQLHLIGCSGWFHGSGSDLCFLQFLQTNVPRGWENRYRIGKKNNTQFISVKKNIHPLLKNSNLGTLALAKQRTTATFQRWRLAAAFSTPMQRLSVNKSPSGQILSVDLPSPL